MGCLQNIGLGTRGKTYGPKAHRRRPQPLFSGKNESTRVCIRVLRPGLTGLQSPALIILVTSQPARGTVLENDRSLAVILRRDPLSVPTRVGVWLFEYP